MIGRWRPLDSKDYETEMLIRYDPLLRKLAGRFLKKAKRYDGGRTEFEDMLQSLRLGFVEDMRRPAFAADKV